MAENLNQRLGASLAGVRKAKGLSQEAVAEGAGLHRTYIGSIERCEANVSLDVVDRLCRFLDVDPCDLLQARSRGSLD